MALGRINEAEAAYRKASELDPGHPAPLYNLACLACRKGDGATALELLERAVSADPAFIAEAMKDPDLDPLRGDPRFTALMNR